MLTKFFMRLFIPYRWEIIKTEEIRFKTKSPFYDSGWSEHFDILYTLKNQYGDIKFVREEKYK